MEKKEDILVEELCSLVISKKVPEALSLLEKSGQEYLADHNWTLLPGFCIRISSCKSEDYDLSDALIIIDNLLTASSPKELVFILLECCEAFRGRSLFRDLVSRLQTSLMQLKTNQYSLDIILGTLYGNIVVNDALLTEYKTIASETDETLMKIQGKESLNHLLGLIKIVSDFMVALVDPIVTAGDAQNQGHMVEYVLRILNYPLLYVHMDDDVFEAVTVLANIIASFKPNLFEELLTPSRNDYDAGSMEPNPIQQARMSEKSDPCALGNLCHALLVHRVTPLWVPEVYSACYRFRVLLPTVSSLWPRSSNHAVMCKALELLEEMMKSINALSLDSFMMDLAEFKGMFSFLFYAMQFCELLPLRRKAAELLRTVLVRMSQSGKYTAFNWMLETVASPELLGFIYTIIKDNIHDQWGSNEERAHFVTLLSKIFCPPIEGSGDLIGDLDRISAALNLARYLAARGKNRASSFTTDMQAYVNKYIIPVGKCLEESIAELEKRLLEPVEGLEAKPAIDVSVSVGNEVIENNEQLEREATEASLRKLQMVQYVHRCLTESLVA